MKNWNVVITVYQSGFRRALRSLAELGSVERSPYHNVLLMNVQDPVALLEAVERRTEENPALYDAISRIAPAMETVDFHSPEEFRDKVKDQLLRWISQLAGRSFHVRFHRRGPRTNLRTPDVEQFLDDALLDRLSHDGTTGKISFTDPDFVLAVDSVDDRAGMGLWTRDDLNRHRLLRPD